MGWFPETIFGRDIDDVFAYSTVKFVNIRDRRLGLVKWLLTAFVVLYVCLYSLWYNGLYLESSPLTGACRFTLQQPTVDDCDPTKPGCLNDYGLPADAAYCGQSSGAYGGKKYPCEFYENIGAQKMFDSSLLVSTRVTTLGQSLACNATVGAPTCPTVYDVDTTATAYVMAAERFTVLVDHSVLATSIKHLEGTSGDLDGRLYVKAASRLCRDFSASSDPRGLRATRVAPCYVKPNVTARGLDYFSLAVLLEAAGASLDDVNYGGETYRETGASLILEINYENFRGWPGVGQITYSYRLRRLFLKLLDLVRAGKRSF